MANTKLTSAPESEPQDKTQKSESTGALKPPTSSQFSENKMPPKPDPEFNLEAFQLSQDYGRDAGVEKILIAIPVGRPKETFFRIHEDPAFCFQAKLLASKADRETYLVANNIWAHVPETAPYTIHTGITRQNDVFLLDIRLPGPDGRDNNWWASLRLATEIAKSKWIRVNPNHPLNAYDVLVAKDNDRIPAPIWPKGDMVDFMKIAFRGKVIDSLDHPYLRRLRGEL